MSSVVYYRNGEAVALASSDPFDPAFYRDYLFLHRFNDVFGHVPGDQDGFIMDPGEVFYSTCGVYEPESVRDGELGNSDGINGCWSPDPRNAVSEYVGVRFSQPVQVTGFQFVSGQRGASACPYGGGPCGYPTAFALEASNDATHWTRLFSLGAFTGMRVADQSPYPDEDSSWWSDGVFLSDRLDVPNDHYFLAYRMLISAFKPDKKGNYNIAELIFYGASE